MKIRAGILHKEMHGLDFARRGGRFVMNTPAQIQQAFADYRNGRLGKIPALTT